jgi:hypothetical protein
MTTQLRTVIFMMMFGIFMSNNVIVPVHQLSHVNETEDAHDAELINCDIVHAGITVATLNSGFTAFHPRVSHSLDQPPNIVLVVALSKSATHIRAPPLLT